MRTRLTALAALLGVAALIAAPLAAGAAPGSTVSSSGGSSGGGGGAHGGGGRGGGGGHGGGGHFGAAGRFGGGRFVSSGGYRGGGVGSTAGRTAYMSHGGYVAHGSYSGQHGDIAHGDYRIVGSQSGGLVRTATALPGGRNGQMVLAVGPRMGSAAKALRVASGMSRMRPPPRHPPQPKRPRHTASHYQTLDYEQTVYTIPLFCDFNVPVTEKSPRDVMNFGCPGAVRAPIKRVVGR